MRQYLTVGIGAAAIALAVLGAGPAMADDVEAALEAALEAYRAGDIALAKEEADFAVTLLGELKVEGLAGLLPPAPAGWAREVENEASAIAAFGGGLVATARYESPGGEDVEITLMADNPVVASMAAMLSNPALMAAMGSVKRRGRQKYLVTQDGDIQALVGQRILVQVGGTATAEEKAMLFDGIDLQALADF